MKNESWNLIWTNWKQRLWNELIFHIENEKDKNNENDNDNMNKKMKEDHLSEQNLNIMKTENKMKNINDMNMRLIKIKK